MNPLLQKTKTEILERQTLSADAFPDYHILSAIDAYDLKGSAKHRAQEFVKALSPLWEMYEKGSYVPLFNKFIDLERGIEAISSEHSSHVNHVIQEFLFGYNILMNCEYLKSEYSFIEGKNDARSKFGELFFSWMAASLLHDVGYDIEKSPEEEAFREKKNAFWDFMTHRAITFDPLTFSVTGQGRKMIEEYILKDIKNIPNAPLFSYVEFEHLFFRDVPERKGWVRYDHGIISAIKYLVELEKLQNDRGGNYLNWLPNRYAILAMALHNFRYKNCDLKLSFTHPSTVVAYLLIVSDEVQVWERERDDADAEMPGEVDSGRNAEKNTELIGISFRNKYAFVTLNHKLKDPALKEKYEKYFAEKIVLQKKHYPIKVLYTQLSEMLLNEITIAAGSAFTDAVSSIMDGDFLKFIEITNNTLDKINVPAQQLESLQKIAETETVKNFMVPSHPAIYEVYVDHRIDSKPFLTVVFPF